jgi:hypothetical protein
MYNAFEAWQGARTARPVNGLGLRNHPGFEQVKADVAGYVGE